MIAGQAVGGQQTAAVACCRSLFVHVWRLHVVVALLAGQWLLEGADGVGLPGRICPGV